MEKNKICFSAYVFGEYTKYIPFYLYSIGVNYPGVDVLIFTDEVLNSKIKKYIFEINLLFDNARIIVLNDLNKLKNLKITGGARKLYRWIIPEEYFKEYDYIYFGDVDIFLLKEKPNLIDFHIKQMGSNDSCFSNKVRYKNGVNQKRLTGLHFIDRKNYFNQTGELVNKLWSDTEELKNFCNEINRDEEFLYKIVDETIGIDPLKYKNFKRPWHGIHFGGSRGYKVDVARKNKEILLKDEEVQEQIIKLTKDELFNNLINNISDDKIITYFKYFSYPNISLRRRTQYFLNHQKYKLKKILR